MKVGKVWKKKKTTRGKKNNLHPWVESRPSEGPANQQLLPTRHTRAHTQPEANLDEVIPGITGAEGSLEEQVVPVRLLLGLNQLVILLAVQ